MCHTKSVRQSHRTWLMRAPALTLLITLMMTLGVGCHQERTESIRLMNQGIKAYRAGQIDSAVRSLEMAGAVDPSNYSAFYYQGMILNDQASKTHNEAQYQEAIKALRGCVAANKEHAEGYYQLGLAHYELSQTDEAIKAFDQAIQLKGGHGDASLLKGKALLVKRAYNEAQRSFHQAIRIKPQLIEPYQALSMLYRKFHQAAAAAQVLKNAIENHDEVYEFYRDLGQIYAGQEQFSKAIPLYEKALKLNPTASTLMFLLARAHMQSKDYRRAEVLLKTFMRRGVTAETQLEHKAAKQMLLEIKKR